VIPSTHLPTYLPTYIHTYIYTRGHYHIHVITRAASVGAVCARVPLPPRGECYSCVGVGLFACLRVGWLVGLFVYFFVFCLFFGFDNDDKV
jgi:hypothetical protein